MRYPQDEYEVHPHLPPIGIGDCKAAIISIVLAVLAVIILRLTLQVFPPETTATGHSINEVAR